MMDLRSMLNASDGAASAAAPAPPPPPSKSLQQAQHQLPSTPIQIAPPQSFRDYSQSTQASPGRSVSHDYAAQQTPSTAFASPPAYPPPTGPYGGRTAPPPLQPLTSHDARSPRSVSVPAPSPYRHTPTSSVSGGYPFPPTQPASTSPVQRHQYPPASAHPPPRESFSQTSAPVGITGPAGPPSYMQGQPMPQTPPVGTPGGPHPYPHQRSQSTHSTPTPTSAQSQQQYGAPFAQGSPVVAHHPNPQPYETVRHPSQPPTPLGPPLSAGQRAPSLVGSYVQPPSPYQRVSSAASYQHPTQTSPPPPPPSSIPRMPGNQGVYDQQGTYHSAELHRRSQSQTERDRSVSVSPKTRIPSLPSSSGHPSASMSETDPRHMQPTSTSAIGPERERAVTPAKRKMDDRDLRSDEIERQEARPPPFEVNGAHVPPFSSRATRASASPIMQRKKRPPKGLPMPIPPWAHQYANGMPLNNPNFQVRKGAHTHLNGKHEPTGSSEISRHNSPEATRSATAQPAQAPEAADDRPVRILAPWEPSITGKRPLEELTKKVADFFFLNVISNPELGEIQNRGVQFEIEAKLGTLISKDTNQRIVLPVETECILQDTGRVAFRSSMTVAEHRSFNEYLNSVVFETDPRNPSLAGQTKKRVPVVYKHRYESDKFYELTSELQSRLPACVRVLMHNKHPKLRVTYDQKTGEVIAKIVKARVNDINIFFPGYPMDCRISINLEMAWDGPVEEVQQLSAAANRERPSDRDKDRLSYSHGHYQIDLTQVTQLVPGPNNTQRMEKEHELEIELAAGILIEQGQRAASGAEHAYQELVEGFVDNVRVLARKALTFPPREI